MKNFEHYLNKVKNRINESGSKNNLHSTTKNTNNIKVGDKVWSILGPYAGKDKFYGIVDDIQPTELFVTFYDVNTDEKVSASTQMVYDYIHKYNKLRSVTVQYGDGTEITTSMAAHLTDDEIKDYFKIGKMFNLGNAKVPGEGNYGDNMQPVKAVIINESLNENLKKSDLINILEKYTKWLVDGGKLNVKNIPDLVNQFMGLDESINESINIMSIPIPPIEEWIDIKVTPISNEIVKGFNYMGKIWAIRDKDLDMFKANWGKNVKFKYDSTKTPRFMEFPVITNPIVNESTSYTCETCGERAEHEEMQENPDMKCSNCGDRAWTTE